MKSVVLLQLSNSPAGLKVAKKLLAFCQGGRRYGLTRGRGMFGSRLGVDSTEGLNPILRPIRDPELVAFKKRLGWPARLGRKSRVPGPSVSALSNFPALRCAHFQPDGLTLQNSRLWHLLYGTAKRNGLDDARSGGGSVGQDALFALSSEAHLQFVSRNRSAGRGSSRNQAAVMFGHHFSDHHFLVELKRQFVACKFHLAARVVLHALACQDIGMTDTPVVQQDDGHGSIQRQAFALQLGPGIEDNLDSRSRY